MPQTPRLVHRATFLLGMLLLVVGFAHAAQAASGTAPTAVDATDPTLVTPADQSMTVDATDPDVSIATAPLDPTTSTATSGTDTDTDTDATGQADTTASDSTPPDTTIPVPPDAATSSSTATLASVDAPTTPAASTIETKTTAATAPMTPDTRIAAGPSNTVTGQTTRFSFASDQRNASFECALDDQPFVRCQSPAGFSALTEGRHAFRVRAVAGGGKADPTPAARTWIVDATGPIVTLRRMPLKSGISGTTNARTANATFSAHERGATFKCALDSPALTPCTSPLHLSGLSPGSHTLVVIAIDRHGNASSTAAIERWTIVQPPATRSR